MLSGSGREDRCARGRSPFRNLAREPGEAFWGLLALGLVAARPDQRVAGLALGFEGVGINREGEKGASSLPER